VAIEEQDVAAKIAEAVVAHVVEVVEEQQQEEEGEEEQL
jgi:hypothetical protein